MFKRVVVVLAVVAIPVGVAWLVQSNASRNARLTTPPTPPTPAPPITQSSGQVDPAELRAAVDHLLTVSAKAWNGGNLDGFMHWYEKTPTTTYVGSGGLVHGWDGIRQRYAPLFEPDAERDSLRFEELETRPLAPGFGLATARYVLFDADSVTATGLFTLLLEEKPEGWRIVHDHSS